MEQRLAMYPPAQLAMISELPITTFTIITQEYVSHSDKAYVLIITWDAPALEILRFIEHFSSQFQQINLLQYWYIFIV
jgi:hypothetical protein